MARIPLGRFGVFLAILALALIALVPMRVGLAMMGFDDQGLSAREARGTIWNGLLLDARFGEAGLGHLDAELGFWPLFLGQARVDLASRLAEGASGEGLRAALSVAGDRSGLDDATARLAVGALVEPLPVSVIGLEDVTVHFRDGLCEEASGTVTAELAGGYLPGQSLSGTAQCRDDRLVLPLAGPDGATQLTLGIDASGAYQAELVVAGQDNAINAQLAAAGFEPGPNGYRLVREGSF